MSERNYSPWRWFLHNLPEDTAALPAVLDDGGAVPAKAELRARIRRTRRQLEAALGRQPEPVPLNVEVLESTDCGTYRRDHIVYDTERWMSVQGADETAAIRSRKVRLVEAMN